MPQRDGSRTDRPAPSRPPEPLPEPGPAPDLPPESAELRDRFLASFRRIERHLEEAYGRGRRDDFWDLLRRYRERGGDARVADDLDAFRRLRNLLSHETIDRLAVPTPEAVAAIERVEARLTRPPLVGDAFGGEVATLRLDARLSDALERIRRTGHAQFPVRDARDGGRVVGLLSESGVARWLARAAADGRPLPDPVDVPLEDVLPDDARRGRFAWIGERERVDDVAARFRADPALEALLVSARGEEGGIRGIVVRKDLVGWSDG